MAKPVNEVIQHFKSLYNGGAIYLWGANTEVITLELCERLFKQYGNGTYTQAYYYDKYIEGAGKIGADCSGSFKPVSGFDTTAQGYYNRCIVKGIIGSIDRSRACLVFKGNSVTSIKHIGFYCGDGYVIEMKSSKDNCTKSKLDSGKWDFYGIPDWIDYTTTTVKGVDISKYQGDVDFMALKNGGYSFVIIRSASGEGEVDVKYQQNMTGATNAGLTVGVYKYSRDLNEQQAIQSANKVIKLLNGRKVTIFLDLENGEQLAQIGKAGITKIAKAFIKTCQDEGYKAYIYCNLDWIKNYIDVSLKPYAIWIARYGKNNGQIDNSYKPNVGEKIWQYSSKGSVKGINGNVDLDICYDMSVFDEGGVMPEIYTETPMNILGRITANSLNIRKAADKTSSKVGVYTKGTLVSLVAKTSNGWYKTLDGYISGDYVEYVVGAVTCDNLNVRAIPNTAGAKITVIHKGDTFLVISGLNGWFNILLPDNKVGWVSGEYVELR